MKISIILIINLRVHDLDLYNAEHYCFMLSFSFTTRCFKIHSFYHFRPQYYIALSLYINDFREENITVFHFIL